MWSLLCLMMNLPRFYDAGEEQAGLIWSGFGFCVADLVVSLSLTGVQERVPKARWGRRSDELRMPSRHNHTGIKKGG